MFMKLLPNKKVVTEGFDELVLSGPTIFLSNHPSKEDIPLLHDLLPKEVVFALGEQDKKEHKELLKNRKHISYDVLNPKTLEKVKEMIESGQPILLFPEVIRSNTGSLMKIYDELSQLIEKTDATIYPIGIFGTDGQNHFPYPSVKIVLEKPFKLESTTNAAVISNQIDRLFRLIRFQHANKTGINLFNELIETAKKVGEKQIILEDTSSAMTYKDLLLAIYVFQNKLKPLLKDEANVGVFLPTVVGNVLTLFSLFKLGKTPALLNFSMDANTLVDCVETAGIHTILTSKVFIKSGELEESVGALSTKCRILYLEDIKASITTSDKLKGLSDYTLSKKADAGKNELILFTSGSENKPKGVLLTHDNLFANIQQALSVIDITSKDRMFNAMPMFHSFGLTVGSILPLITGMYVFLYPSPLHHKIIPELVYQKEASILFGTSTFFSMYGKNAHGYDLHSVRLAIVGAEKLKDDVYQLWFERFGIRIYEGYGVTETAPILSLNTPTAYKRGSVGKLLPGLEYKIQSVDGIERGGNLIVKGPNVMKGYLIHGKGFIPLNEWHETGDVVDVDEQGFVSIVSRLKRFAKIGGEMISLNVIEELALQCFGSSSFAAVAIPDKRKGEKIVLFATSEEHSARELKKFIKAGKYSSLFIPKEVHTLEEIPTLGTGKTDYVRLQALAVELYH